MADLQEPDPPTPGNPTGQPPSIYNFRPLGERPGYEAEARRFEDPAVPGWWTYLVCRPLFGGRRLDAIHIARDLRIAHVTGIVDSDGQLVLDERKKPIQLPEPVFTPYGYVTPHDADLQTYANLTAMWASPDRPVPTFGEFLGWREATDIAYLEIAAWIGSIMERPSQAREKPAAPDDVGNSSGGPTITASAESSDTAAVTPSPSSAPTPSSTPSNEASGPPSPSSAPSSPSSPAPFPATPATPMPSIANSRYAWSDQPPAGMAYSVPGAPGFNPPVKPEP